MKECFIQINPDRSSICRINSVFLPSKWDANKIFFVICTRFWKQLIGRGARVVEEARLESVYTPKVYRGFESRSLRKFYVEKR